MTDHNAEFENLVAELRAEDAKPARKKRRANEETKIQREIQNAISAHGLWCVRLPVQGTLQQIGKGQAVLKSSPLVGFPDLMVIGPEGTIAWLEVKTSKGKLTPIQRGRHAQLSALAHIVAVVCTPDQAIGVLRANWFIQ